MSFVARDGRRHGWLDVESHIKRILRTKFPRVEREILADASQEALLDLMGYWQFLPSAGQGAGLDFHYALLRGVHTAATKVFAQVGQRRMEVPTAFGTGYADDESEEDWDAFEFTLVDPDPTPDEVLDDGDLIERARRMLSDLDPEELADWFNNLLTPETEREQSDREGRAPSTIHERRTVRAKRVREGARKYGLFF